MAGSVVCMGSFWMRAESELRCWNIAAHGPYCKDAFLRRSIGSSYSLLDHPVNLRQLQYLLAIADEGSFTRAAKQLLVAQPSLSQQIKSLEHELGGPLLERLPTGVRLTAA